MNNDKKKGISQGPGIKQIHNRTPPPKPGYQARTTDPHDDPKRKTMHHVIAIPFDLLICVAFGHLRPQPSAQLCSCSLGEKRQRWPQFHDYISGGRPFLGRWACSVRMSIRLWVRLGRGTRRRVWFGCVGSEDEVAMYHLDLNDSTGEKTESVLRFQHGVCFVG